MAGNYYTETGELLVTDYMQGVASPPADFYIDMGTGGGTHSKTSAALITPASEARVAVTESQPSADTAQFLAQITADGTKTVDEAGLFDAVTGGNMLMVGDNFSRALALNDIIEFTFTLQQS